LSKSQFSLDNQLEGVNFKPEFEAC